MLPLTLAKCQSTHADGDSSGTNACFVRGDGAITTATLEGRRSGILGSCAWRSRLNCPDVTSVTAEWATGDAGTAALIFAILATRSATSRCLPDCGTYACEIHRSIPMLLGARPGRSSRNSSSRRNSSGGSSTSRAERGASNETNRRRNTQSDFGQHEVFCSPQRASSASLLLCSRGDCNPIRSARLSLTNQSFTEL